MSLPNAPNSAQSGPAQPYVPPQAIPAGAARPEDVHVVHGVPVLRIYGHSPLLYWWPVWAAGYIMAIITAVGGHRYEIGNYSELFTPSSNPGVVFFAVLFLVILATNLTARGLASAVVILLVLLAVVLLALFDVWDQVLTWLGQLRIHMNFAAYFWFSTVLFVAWALSVFVFDRLSYWEVKPGQLTQDYVFGGGSRSFETEGMTVEKYRGDLFRHWILGLGAGDLHIRTSGPNSEHIDIYNVPFIGTKIRTLQEMVAVRPDALGPARR